jgi:SSS family solute:Na+ symporter
MGCQQSAISYQKLALEVNLRPVTCMNFTMKFLSKIFLIVLLMSACHSMESQTKEQPADLKEEAVNTLRKILHEQQEWVKVHAAEFLIWSGYPGDVKEAYLKELERFHKKPQYRIGIWRVLAQLSNGNEAAQYKAKIVNAFLDTAGRDRIHAIETMAKLKISPLPQYPEVTGAALHSDVKSLSAYTHWAVAYTNEDSAKAAGKYFLGRLLDANGDILQRRVAAYILRNSGELDMTDWNALSDMALTLPDDAEGKVSFLNAALLTAPQEMKTSETYKNIFDSFLAFSNKKDKGIRMDIAAGLAVAGGKEHLPVLADWMRNADPTGIAADDADVQASAAYAILKILEREPVNN